MSLEELSIEEIEAHLKKLKQEKAKVGKKPTKPKAPIAPKETITKRDTIRTIGAGDSVSLADLLLEVPKDIDARHVVIESEFDRYDDYMRVTIRYNQELPNPRFAEELASYENKMKIHQINLDAYETALTRWKEKAKQ